MKLCHAHDVDRHHVRDDGDVVDVGDAHPDGEAGSFGDTVSVHVLHQHATAPVVCQCDAHVGVTMRWRHLNAGRRVHFVLGRTNNGHATQWAAGSTRLGTPL